MRYLAFPVAALSLVACADVFADCSSEDYTGTICTVAYPYCPMGTMAAAGQELMIQQFQQLYAVVGSLYGGDNQTKFNLPDLRGRTAINAGKGTGLTQDIAAGKALGTATYSVQPANVPPLAAAAAFYQFSSPATLVTPVANAMLATPVRGTAPQSFWAAQATAASSLVALAPSTVQTAGTATPGKLDTRTPALALQYCVVVNGVYPTRP